MYYFWLTVYAFSPFKVIQGQRRLHKPKEYYFLLVINNNRDLSFILHRFPNIIAEKQVENNSTLVWAPDQGDSRRILSSN